MNEKSGVTEKDVTCFRSCLHPFSNYVGQNLAILKMMHTATRTSYYMDVKLAPECVLGEVQLGLDGEGEKGVGKI